MRTAISRRATKGGKDIRSSKLSGLRRPISSALAHRGGWETEASRPVKFIQASFRIGLGQSPTTCPQLPLTNARNSSQCPHILSPVFAVEKTYWTGNVRHSAPIMTRNEEGT